jgi:hypothetical protein
MALNIARRYQNNMIESKESTDNDDNNDRKRHWQTQFTNTEMFYGKGTFQKSKSISGMESHLTLGFLKTNKIN